jgi:hypothetical protein
MRHVVRRFLLWSILLAVLLPVVLAVVLGLGALLKSLGDAAGAIACGRLGLAIGAVWFMALAATATAGGIVALESAPPPPPPPPPRPERTEATSVDG